ncbi:MAG: hypothetical protein J5J00_07960 [Deltaproteobacteria bacterium]|nr:hypothetical protein [Deltaproteobacteria bacterium]
MDETTKAIIDRITVRKDEPFKTPNGHTATVFYDCIQLSPNELARLAAQAVGHLEHDAFDIAVGLAYAGIFFSAAVAGGRQVAILQADGEFTGPPLNGKKVVVVDDVVHSGRRIGGAAERVKASGGIVVGLACIVDRSNGSVGSKETPLWSAFQTEML